MLSDLHNWTEDNIVLLFLNETSRTGQAVVLQLGETIVVLEELETD